MSGDASLTFDERVFYEVKATVPATDTMKEKTVKAYAKINLSLDVMRKRSDGYHEVDMVLQAIDLADTVIVGWQETKEPLTISLSCSTDDVPADESNIAYKAAALMAQRAAWQTGEIAIEIEKNIPVAAGLAGGSSNGAAVICALNDIWQLDLDAEEAMKIGGKLGADVPFAIGTQMGVFTCARATGIGTDLEPLTPFVGSIILATPYIAVSTAAAYKGIDDCEIKERPKTDALICAIKRQDREIMAKNMRNVLENHTLARYDGVDEKKNRIMAACEEGDIVLMSGSGPSIFVIPREDAQAEKIYARVRGIESRSFLIKTL